MKKIILSLIAVLSLGLALYAQNSVQDALKAIPVQDAKSLEALMKAVAKDAPQSVVDLAAMLKPAEERSNNIVEYAISAISNFGTNPEYSKYKKNIKKGFEMAAAAAEDPFNKAFLEAQLRLLSPENAVAPVYKSKNIRKYSKLWDKPVKLEKALLSKDRKFRTTALKTYNETADETTFQTISEVFPKLTDEAKIDVLNWVGDLRETSMADIVLSQFGSSNPDLAASAMNAGGKIGTYPILLALIEGLDGSNEKAAYAALKAFNGDIRGTVAEAFKNAKGQKSLNLMSLAAERHVTEAAPKIFRMAEREDGIALDCLKDVVTEKDAKRVADLIDKDDYAYSTIAALQKAFDACLKGMDADKKYDTVKKFQEKASHPERFLAILAFIGSDKAAQDICDAYAADPSRIAAAALTQTDNYMVAPSLLNAAEGGNVPALDKYIDLVSKYEPAASKTEKLTSVIGLAKNSGTKEKIIKAFKSIPTVDAIKTVAAYMDDADINIAISAAKVIKGNMSGLKGKIDKQEAVGLLTKASAVFKKRGFADDNYAVDEIKDIIAKF